MSNLVGLLRLSNRVTINKAMSLFGNYGGLVILCSDRTWSILWFLDGDIPFCERDISCGELGMSFETQSIPLWELFIYYTRYCFMFNLVFVFFFCFCLAFVVVGFFCCVCQAFAGVEWVKYQNALGQNLLRQIVKRSRHQKANDPFNCLWFSWVLLEAQASGKERPCAGWR